MSFIIAAERPDAPTYYRTRVSTWVTGFQMSRVKVFETRRQAEDAASAFDVTGRKIVVKEIA